MTRRVVQLIVGLLLYGAGCALTVEAGLGVDPWTVFAQGISIHTGIGIGWVTNIVGFLILLLWSPLRQKPRSLIRRTSSFRCRTRTRTSPHTPSLPKTNRQSPSPRKSAWRPD